MKSQANNQMMNDTKQIVVKSTIALSLLITLIGQTVISAPEASAHNFQTMNIGMQYVAQGLGPDQDSLLPPEVVPLDSTGGASYQASQQQAAQMNPYSAPSAAASSNSISKAPAVPAQAMQSSREWRKAAFDSLMNNPGAQPTFGNPQQGQMANGGQAGSQPGVGQSGWTGANGQAMPSPSQSQTLSGKVQQPSYPKKNSGPSGLANAAHVASLAAMFGTGAMTGVLMTRRSSPLGFYGNGLMGASMLNYGLRNSFSRW